MTSSLTTGGRIFRKNNPRKRTENSKALDSNEQSKKKQTFIVNFTEGDLREVTANVLHLMPKHPQISLTLQIFRSISYIFVKNDPTTEYIRGKKSDAN